MSLPPRARFRPGPRVLVSPVEAEAVILDLETQHWFSLNVTGRRIWELLADGCDVDAVMSALEAEFDVPRTELEADLARLVGELEASGLLRRE